MEKPRRRVLAYVGIACIGLGTAGAMLPVLPTTPFLLLAAWFFARSNPELGERLLNKPIFKPYRPYLDGTRPLPNRLRYITILFVWIVVGLSAWLVSSRWVTIALLSLAFVGSLFILFWRGRRPVSSPAEDRSDGEAHDREGVHRQPAPGSSEGGPQGAGGGEQGTA